MAGKKNIVFVLTSHSQLGNTGKKTGWYLPEVAHPYNILAPHYNITWASPLGGETPLDPSSAEAFAKDEECIKFLNDPVAQKGVKETVKVEDILARANEFDAVFFPGGHGPMFDLFTFVPSLQLAAKVYENNGVVAAVCHGPAAIVNIKLSNGDSLVKGKRVTSFSNSEEDAVQLSPVMPFLLENALKSAGAKYEKAAKDWEAHVVVDGRLITGQNPNSGAPLGEKLRELLG
ncbi:uncharacterized protein SPPG_05672 [Spizellomyces punctatus DAOM BR117]|uniref:D-lactate dehydratase n=1 Tax=Spizellomyces punctatus (strain DAOM BR117) TaxID=645134 RepID=A0A0L0HEH6_SPIPD|nr:uncharacterized protein SPPG_05672 [Spizellomyces punctatus DAOM BR117]KNC99431.1 hypothetical protein SPPG_05672 [Spizellomyces punctatus DAOM BR117]|eukprot:XP_016607471.1 hypothetical protein SPPG_05672 [Spizellomyces punctatus DAOM BR117]